MHHGITAHFTRQKFQDIDLLGPEEEEEDNLTTKRQRAITHVISANPDGISIMSGCSAMPACEGHFVGIVDIEASRWRQRLIERDSSRGAHQESPASKSLWVSSK